MKHLYPILAVLTLVAIAFFAGRCEREKQPLEKIEQLPAETARLNHRAADSLARAKYLPELQKLTAQNKALQRANSELAYKDSIATEKARHSANTYVKTPTLANCHHALVDCQQENSTKAGIIAGQQRLIAGQQQQAKLDSAEVRRSWAATDSASEGWRKANAGWQAAETAMAKEKNRLRVYGTAAFEQHPLNNNLKVGSTVTRERWLLSYQRGIIEKSNEVKAGVLLW